MNKINQKIIIVNNLKILFSHNLIAVTVFAQTKNKLLLSYFMYFFIFL